MFPLAVCEACGRLMTTDEESVCYTCALSTFATSGANLSATSRAAASLEQVLWQELPRFCMPGHYPMTLRDICVARQRWRLEVLLTGKAALLTVVSQPPYRWAGTITYRSEEYGYAPAMRSSTVIACVLDFVYPKLRRTADRGPAATRATRATTATPVGWCCNKGYHRSPGALASIVGALTEFHDSIGDGLWILTADDSIGDGLWDDLD